MASSTNAAKRLLYIMPIVFITYSLAYLGRANFSFASAAGINEDPGITKGISSLPGAVYEIGTLAGQHLPDPRQPGDGAVDVGRLLRPYSGARLA